MRTAHPRSRGENARPSTASALPSGSSPLTRGKPGDLGNHQRRGGLIPAHAGKTPRRGRTESPQRAHPRSRGENRWPTPRPTTPAGSSPLTRGKLLCSERSPRLPRLIPAHAGKTPPISTHAPESRAHPRSRGENLLFTLPYFSLLGSSPLTRGKLNVSGVRASAAAAHPRSRGENLPISQERMTPSGSSPLTRGKRVSVSREPRSRGLIPAHAGKTGPPLLASPVQRAHPRSRGENETPDEMADVMPGSSPLTRGKHNPAPW